LASRLRLARDCRWIDLQNYLVDETGIEPATSSLRTMRISL
jgi:hypothetical protein